MGERFTRSIGPLRATGSLRCYGSRMSFSPSLNTPSYQDLQRLYSWPAIDRGHKAISAATAGHLAPFCDYDPERVWRANDALSNRQRAEMERDFGDAPRRSAQRMMEAVEDAEREAARGASSIRNPYSFVPALSPTRRR